MYLKFLTSAALSSLVLLACAQAANVQVIPVTPPSAIVGYASAINSRGDVAGFFTLVNQPPIGFIRTASGSFDYFHFPGSGGVDVRGINDSATLTGFYNNSNSDLVNHSFVRTVDGTFTIIDVGAAGAGPNQGTLAYSINATGTVAGYYVDAANTSHGFLRSAAGPIIKFEAPGAGPFGTQAQAINDSEVTTGNYADAQGSFHGFIRNADDTFVSFDVPGSSGTFPTAIDSNGTITGYSYGGSCMTTKQCGFVRAADGTIATFGAPQTSQFFPQAINQSGTVVGYCTQPPDLFGDFGFIRSPAGKIQIFQIPQSTPTMLFGINEAGSVVGSSLDVGFILIP